MLIRGAVLLFISFYLIGDVSTADTGNTTSNFVNSCSCQKSCHQLSHSSPLAYFYDTATASCVQLSPSCVTHPSCTFSSQVACIALCGAVSTETESGGDVDSDGAKLGGCEATKLGCCPDGSPRPMSRKCSDQIDSAKAVPGSSSSDQSVGVRWDMVATGLCVLVLLVAVLSVSGIMAYHYKERQKGKLRSRYIHDVLEMYESESESSEADSGKEHAHKDNGKNWQLYVKV